MVTYAYSFWKGWNQLRVSDASEVREEIMAALNLKCRPAFSKRRNGYVEPTISQYNAIIEIFNKRGIVDIWGES